MKKSYFLNPLALISLILFLSFSFTDGPNTWTLLYNNLGRVYLVAVAPSSQTTIYEAGLDSGVYKSTNAGVNWTQVNTGMTYFKVQALAISPSNPSIIYAGTDQLGSPNSGIYKSTNAGASWTLMNSGITETSIGIQAIVVHPTDPNTAWMTVFDGLVNSTNGVYKTTNGGTTWFAANGGMTIINVLSLAINPLNPNVLYAGTSYNPTAITPTKIYKTYNGGTNWVEVSNGLPTGTTTGDPVRALSISTSDTARVLAGLFMNDTLGGAYLTTNGGTLWAKKHNGLGNVAGTLIRNCMIRPGSNTEFYVGLDGGGASARGVWRTTDAGNTWVDFNNGAMVNTFTVRGLAFKTTGDTTIYSGCSAVGFGVFGYSWPTPIPAPVHYFSAWCPAQTLPNIPAASLYNACAWLGDTLYMQAPDGAGTAATTVQRYSLSGNSWSAGVPIPTAKVQGTLTACGGKLYFIGGGATAGGAGSVDVYQYTPATGWVTKAPVPAAINGHGAVAWGDSVIFVIMGPWGTPTTTVYYYNVNTNTWGTSTAFTGTARRSHAVGLWGNKIYVAGGYPFTNTFYIGTIGSTAATITWVAGPVMPIGGSNSLGRSRLGGVAIGDKFYVVGGNNYSGIPTSTDSTLVWNITGATWSVIPSKPAAVHNNEAAVTAKQFGDTVKIYCPGGSSQAATTLNFDVIGCGTVVVGVPPKNEIPLTYSLSQNYPNPFNPVTKINYSIQKPGIVKLTVYDILGKEVTLLVNEFKQSGNYSVEFNATNLASGVYFYRIEAGDFRDVKKMVLIK